MAVFQAHITGFDVKFLNIHTMFDTVGDLLKHIKREGFVEVANLRSHQCRSGGGGRIVHSQEPLVLTITGLAWVRPALADFHDEDGKVLGLASDHR